MKTQKKPTHTPGPWTVHLPSDVQKVYPMFAVHASSQDLHSTLAQGIFTLAEVKVAIGGEPVREANARLIAAAPDLLEAVKDALHYMVAVLSDVEANEGDVEDVVIKSLRAAIAKAEGR